MALRYLEAAFLKQTVWDTLSASTLELLLCLNFFHPRKLQAEQEKYAELQREHIRFELLVISYALLIDDKVKSKGILERCVARCKH